jgi:hypothetical protein
MLMGFSKELRVVCLETLFGRVCLTLVFHERYCNLCHRESGGTAESGVMKIYLEHVGCPLALVVGGGYLVPLLRAVVCVALLLLIRSTK